MSGKVFVVQEPRRPGGSAVYDISPAQQYGDLHLLLPAGAVSLNPAPMVQELRHKLRNFSDNDYLLATGDPVAIGIATAVAASFNQGRVRMLRWNKQAGCYVEIPFNVYGGTCHGVGL